jgi:long-subunit acyl-CoA synthetase (AMP-forming)
VNNRILSALATHAAQTPQRVAVTGSRQMLTWRALATGVDRLAGRLAGVRVLGLLAGNSPAWIVTDLAALKAGCVHLPLPVFFSDVQLRHAIADARVDTLITDDPGRILQLFPSCALEIFEVAGQSFAAIRLPAAAEPPPADTVKITYTSGTTGTPRGVRLSATAIETVAAALADAAGAVPGDRACVLLPLAILLENIGSVYVPLLAGARIIVPDPERSGVSGSSDIDPARLAAVLLGYRPTSLIVPPGLLKLLVQMARARSIPDSLRFIAVGGAPVGRDLLHSAQRLGLPVYQGYGLSEAASVVTLNTPQHNRPGSACRPLPQYRLSISLAGEILVHGIVGTGYLGKTDNALEPELATGDLGYLDEDGFLYVTGRMCNRIVTAFGRNVSPEWVESELLSHPDIVQAAVLGSNLPTLAAVLVARQGVGHLQLGRAVDAVNDRLPDYARIGRWLCADAPFSRGSGELSAAGAVERAVVERHYHARLGAGARQRCG